MTRDANLYILTDKDWKPLADIIEHHSNSSLKTDITIFQLHSVSSKVNEYAIISLSDTADKLVMDYGATLAGEPNIMRNSLHNYNGDPLFGDKSNLTFLNKP